ncbi:hypothetical protein JY97_08725 [Alkalispirochaeta odontotermitis]|nr:hypothetical protein JY97_08725 [Alkalispirochaeta odontotermitis]CAB1083071.1 hypothetical protein D1AOALGA4SA_10655 [Olavius algarvensis Delta 1 endosymbiont]
MGADDRGQRTKVRDQRTEDRGQRTEDRRQRTGDRISSYLLFVIGYWLEPIVFGVQGKEDKGIRFKV